MAKAGIKNLRHKLNHMNPTASESALGDLLEQVLEAYNDLAGKYNQLLTKIDTDFAAQNTAIEALRSFANSHTHTENTAAAYTQNAATTAPTTTDNTASQLDTNYNATLAASTPTLKTLEQRES